jgi:hypothetical protein
MHPNEGDEIKKRKYERVKWKTRRRKRKEEKKHIHIYKIWARGDFVKNGKWGGYPVRRKNILSEKGEVLCRF